MWDEITPTDMQLVTPCVLNQKYALHTQIASRCHVTLISCNDSPSLYILNGLVWGIMLMLSVPE